VKFEEAATNRSSFRVPLKGKGDQTAQWAYPDFVLKEKSSESSELEVISLKNGELIID
jgi:hypothetical protein